MPLIYDIFMIGIITASLIPLLFKGNTPFLYHLDKITIFLFAIDYLLRFFTSKPIYKYPLSFMGIIDFLALLPSLPIPIFAPYKWIRLLKLIRLISLLKALKLLRYSTDSLLFRVLKKQKAALLLVWSLAAVYTFICALIIFNVEPDTFENFFEAFYWSVMSLTTVGYGDICPVTYAGRTIAMISTFIGMALIALPSGIIAAGYMAELRKQE